MSNTPNRPNSLEKRLPVVWIWIAVGLVALSLLAALPGAWARPDQAPDYQTVPTATPTPTSPGAGPTATPTRPSGQPTNTPPRPTNTPAPTDTPRPGQPTNTPAPPTSTPPPTATPPPGQPTATPGAAQAGLPPECFTLPTPGFQPVQSPTLGFEAESDYFLVVPDQTVTLRLIAINSSSAIANDLVICNPLDPALEAGQPQTTRGRAYLVPEGLVVELGSLAPRETAEVTITLGIPGDLPLGGVIESQGWLLGAGQQASTGLVTWALPPAWLPPTGG